MAIESKGKDGLGAGACTVENWAKLWKAPWAQSGGGPTND